MKIKSILFIALCFILATACSDKETAPAIEMKTLGEIVLSADTDTEKVIKFHSTHDWKATLTDSGKDQWLSCSPSSGAAGDASVTLKTLSKNSEETRRSASLLLTTGDITEKFIIYQEEGAYAKPEQTTYNIPMEGDTLRIKITSNVEKEKLLASLSNGEWLSWPNPSRAVNDYYIDVIVSPNEGERSRSGSIYFWKNTGEELYENLGSATIIQASKNTGTTTDYSADKKVRTLQTATKGTGIPIVLMGDGFIDKEIADGTYDRTLDKAMEHLFTEEPMRALREYFTIYAVTAVSQHNTFGLGYKTAFGCQLEGGSSTGISGDDKAVMEYVESVPGIDMTEALAVIIVNTPAYAGTAYFGYAQNNKVVEFAIAYCPIIDDLDSENFRAVLVHESVGHGFTKLEDEYSYEENGVIPVEIIDQRKQLQGYGWALNVDFTDDKNKVLWSSFLSDDRYKDENIGIFEGACTYTKGAYRSTEQSMMNGNQGGFNAPSRKAIYDMVIKRGTGKTPTYEEFVTFDREVQSQAQGKSRAVKASTRPFGRPQFMGGKELR